MIQGTFEYSFHPYPTPPPPLPHPIFVNNLNMEIFTKQWLLSHFIITKLFNKHIIFQEYTPFKFVCLINIGQSSFTLLLHEH